jgi:hypothetical protein
LTKNTCGYKDICLNKHLFFFLKIKSDSVVGASLLKADEKKLKKGRKAKTNLKRGDLKKE